MSIFSESVGKAISDYRFLLRKHLTQVDRMTKLQALQLRKSTPYKTELSLYKAAMDIINDIENNMASENPGYYSYSGIDEFAKYLKRFMDDYTLENGVVIHKARKASQAILDSIQLCSIDREQFNVTHVKKLYQYNEVVAKFGTLEQYHLQLQLLEKHQAKNPDAFTSIVAHLSSLDDKDAEIAV